MVILCSVWLASIVIPKCALCIEVLIYLLVFCELLAHLFFIGTKFLANDKKHVARQALCLSSDYNRPAQYSHTFW